MLQTGSLSYLESLPFLYRTFELIHTYILFMYLFVTKYYIYEQRVAMQKYTQNFCTGEESHPVFHNIITLRPAVIQIFIQIKSSHISEPNKIQFFSFLSIFCCCFVFVRVFFCYKIQTD